MTAATPGRTRRTSLSSPALGTALLLIGGFALFVLIHWLLSDAAGHAPALLIGVGWLLACGLMSGFGAGYPVTTLLLAAGGLALTWVNWEWLVAHVEYLYLAQHAGTHALLGLWFGMTLLAARRGQGDPIITRIATKVHGSLPPAIRRYTAAVTAVWAIYFALMTVASCLLFAFGSMTAWSVLANLLTPPIIVAIFVIEYVVRLRRYPDFEHVSIIEGVRAFMK